MVLLDVVTDFVVPCARLSRIESAPHNARATQLDVFHLFGPYRSGRDVFVVHDGNDGAAGVALLLDVIDQRAHFRFDLAENVGIVRQLLAQGLLDVASRFRKVVDFKTHGRLLTVPEMGGRESGTPTFGGHSTQRARGGCGQAGSVTCGAGSQISGYTPLPPIFWNHQDTYGVPCKSSRNQDLELRSGF